MAAVAVVAVLASVCSGLCLLATAMVVWIFFDGLDPGVKALVILAAIPTGALPAGWFLGSRVLAHLGLSGRGERRG